MSAFQLMLQVSTYLYKVLRTILSLPALSGLIVFERESQFQCKRKSA